MAKDPETLAHLEWLGYVQPVGLVVSVPALLAAQAHVNRHISHDHQRFLASLPQGKDDEPIPEIQNFPEFTQSVLGWKSSDLQQVHPDDTQFAPLTIPLPAFHETLAPTYAVREFQPKDPTRPWMLLVKVLPAGTPLDDVADCDERHWQATPQAKFERLLRETEVPAGLLCNGTQLRLVYAPRGETSGYMTFSVPEMMQVAGRPIFAAFHMLLCVERVFGFGLAYPDKQRLTAILADSRKYQNVVSNQLAEQVLAALYELLRGLQAADEQRRGELLRDVLAETPDHVYAGLLTVLLRLVFILFAEDRGLLSNDPVYSNFYSVTGLFDRLRADHGHFPDTMDQRYGAWAQLLTLFRLIYHGGRHGGLAIPPRRGYLFDPNRYNFLEGRASRSASWEGDQVDVPRIADGVIYRVLEKLLILDGERLSYRTLDVEQVGSVYETMMGFNLEAAQGRSIAIKPVKSHGAPTAINLDELLGTKPADRAKWLTEKSDQKITGQAAEVLKSANSIESLLAGLEKKIARHATPNVVPPGAMVLQPSDERRRSGSHYTPRSLTEPIVRTTLKPILEQLGEKPSPKQILALNVCDPAMGSGAFLVEACRQLGDALVEAWHVHNRLPTLPPDEDELLHARRLIAQRCLYGVDKNPMAVDLSKLSLWLATLAKDHPFTFLDHSLRTGDSLVGLSREQIAAFHWQPEPQRGLIEGIVANRIVRATECRAKILAAPEETPYSSQDSQLALADEALCTVRWIADAAVSAFFCADNSTNRKVRREQLLGQIEHWSTEGSQPQHSEPLRAAATTLRLGDHPIQPFHWQIEFPEVFTVDAKGKLIGGFDAIVGNPPFLHGKKISGSFGDGYKEWLATTNPQTNSNSDLVAHFFRRAFNSLRPNGTFGLLATNTISQGDTRFTGLRWICANGGTIYSARKRIRWPGQAAVTVSAVHLIRGTFFGERTLDGRSVPQISAFLFHSGGHEDPQILIEHFEQNFQGSIVLGMGFTFDDTDSSGVSSPLSEMKRIVERNSQYAQLIRPYIGGEEVNDSPVHAHHRFVIDFDGMSEDEARAWPELFAIIVAKVKPQRDKLKKDQYRLKWWQFAERQSALYEAVSDLAEAMVNSQTSSHLAFAFLPVGCVYSNALNVYPTDSKLFFALMQCRVHEVWARFFASSLEDRLRYTPSDCFETFPFPAGVLKNAAGDARSTANGLLTILETAGREYYEFRAALMVRDNEGLTKTYNRFHDRDHDATESNHEIVARIQKLRELHAAMDRTVLEAYGWHDLAETATCEFLLDYEEDEDDEETGGPTAPTRRRKKKPWRYRWPDDFRDEVLARLLELNKQRAEQERLLGDSAQTVDAIDAMSPPKDRRRSPASGQKQLRCE